MLEQDGSLLVERSRLNDAEPDEGVSFELVLEEERFSNGKLWTDELQNVMHSPNWTVDDLAAWADVWLKALIAETEGAGNNSFNAKLKVPGAFYDAIPGNLIIDQNGNGEFFDLEWQFKTPVEIGLVYSRGMRGSFFSLDLVERDKQPCTFKELTCLVGAKIGIELSAKELDAYLSLEWDFQEAVTRFPISKKNKNHLLPIRSRESTFDHLIIKNRNKAKNAAKASGFLSRLLRET
ncbi:MAG: hypothetical protein QNI90_14125 [Dinoroseobacter sp.]|nr:hypothetical protein [Dinoroseobacter sp.]